MGNRDHLVPRITVDRNGYPKTVYVAPPTANRFSSLSSAAPSLASFVNEDDDDLETEDSPWEDISDAESWEANDFSPNDAEDWSYAGFSSDDAHEWRAAGFGFYDAKEWSENGLTSADAKDWMDAGFDSDEARIWSSAGFVPDEASGWKTEFDDATKAYEWSNEGFGPIEAVEWIDGGFKEASDAIAWKDSVRGRRGIEVSDLAVLFEHNLEPEDSVSWLSLLETVKHLDGGKDETLQSLVRVMDGVNPSAGDEYANNYPYERWQQLATAGIEFDKVAPLRRMTAVVASSDFESWGDDDDFEEDEEAYFESALEWISMAQHINESKLRAIESLIRAGKKPMQASLLLSHKGNEYSNDAEHILSAQKWAQEVSSGKSFKEKSELFALFCEALTSIDGFDQIVAKHGVHKVEEAMYHGLRTEPQLLNYLEQIPVAGISEGAL